MASSDVSHHLYLWHVLFENHPMKELTVREAREGLSHPDIMFADDEEILVVRRGEPVARSLAAFRATMPFQEVPSEVLIREDRDARG